MAEITGDNGMYPRASGSLGGPQTPAYTVHVLINILFSIRDFGDFSLDSELGIYFTIEKEYDNSLIHKHFFLYFLLL